MKYKQVYNGEWVQPTRNGYRMMCCDCGLVHVLNFKLVKYGDGKHKIRFQAFRDEKRTALARRKPRHCAPAVKTDQPKD